MTTTTEEIRGADLIERLTALQRPCPACGARLVGARCTAREPGSQSVEAFLGLVCTSCEAMFSLGTPQEVTA